jgi:ferric-dicitrate binding protein FerR (iron transport regulator)
LTHTISQEDEAWLADRLRIDPESRRIWDQLVLDGANCNLQEFLDDLQPEEELESLKHSMLNKHTSRSRIRRFSTLAAAMVGLILLGVGAKWIFGNRRVTDDRNIASLIKQNKSTVRLHLATGKEIDLQDKSKGDKVQIGATTLELDSNKLDFSSSDTALNILTTPQGEVYTIRLEDGTMITLNAASSLRFPFKFNRSTREVYLEGEACFQVSKDARRPFIVNTPLTRVEVLGTVFNVNTYEKDRVATALVEGKVCTGAAGAEAQTLQPGQAAIFNTSKGLSIEDIDRDDVIAWTKGMYYFQDLSFQELSNAISRIYGVAVTFDPALAQNNAISGAMDRNNLPELLEDLRSTIGVKYYYSAQKLHFY